MPVQDWRINPRGKKAARPNALAHQPMPGGLCRSFSPVGYSGLVEDAAYVVADGSDADDRLISYLPVRLVGGNEAQHLHLPLAQTIRAGRGSR